MAQILVHGEKHNMMRLKSKLLSLNAEKPRPVKIFSPANCEELRIPFKADKIAKVVGKLAQITAPVPIRKNPDSSSNATPDRATEQQQPQLVSGVLVQSDFKMSLMAPEDLREYAGLTTTTITCRQRLTLSAAGADLIMWALEGMFGSVDVVQRNKNGTNGKSEPNGTSGPHKVNALDAQVDGAMTTLRVMDCVTIKLQAAGLIEVEWEGNVINDGIADAVMAVLLSVESSPAAVKSEQLLIIKPRARCFY